MEKSDPAAETDRAASSISYWRVIPRSAEDGTPDIDFQVVHPDSPPIQRALKNEIERALSTINSLYAGEKDTRKRSEAFAKLVSLSRVGLVGSQSSPDIALDALRALEADIVAREAGPVKNAYMRKLGFWSLTFGLTSLLAFLFCNAFPQIPFGEITKYRFFFILWSGCMLGTWISFASRKVSLGFYDLVALEDDRVEPALRLVFAGSLTIVLGLVFTTGMANIIIGGFSAEHISSSVSIAF